MKYTLIPILLFLIGCSSNGKFHKLEKLSGTWRAQTDEGFIYEEWSKAENGVMYGKTIYPVDSTSFFDPDSTGFARIRLVKTDSGIFYIPTIKDISFKLTTASDSALIFETSILAYPQKIVYHFITDDSMVVRSLATVRGKPYEFTTHYRRMN